MNIQHFLDSFPHIRLATEKDNQMILDFYHESNMDSDHSKIIYKRGDDFFAFLKERSHHSLTFLLLDDNQKIWGIGVASFRTGFIQGELKTVGYLGDLRVKLNRKLIREWRQMYAEFIKYSPQMPETNYCQHFQTVLIESNKASKNNLAETKIPHLHYERQALYSMINIFGFIKIPFKKNIFTLKYASEIDIPAIVELYNQDNQRPFAHDWKNEIEHRLKNWNGFTIDHFVLIYKGNNLVAVTNFWNAKKNKQIIVSKIPTILKRLAPIFKLLPLVKMKPLPDENKPLDILYLNRFAFSPIVLKHEKKEILSEAVQFLFERPENLLAFADFNNDSYLKKNSFFLKESMDMGFYTVHYKSDDKQLYSPLKWSHETKSPEFDMATV